MSLTPFLIGLYGFAVLCALIAFGHGAGARRHWRNRRRARALHRSLWSLVFVLLALIGAIGGTALLGYRRIASEALVADLTTKQIDGRRYEVAIAFPDGSRRDVELTGDEWQLDARVIKWDVRAVVLGAPVLYRLDRISGRYRDAAEEASAPKSVVALSSPGPADLWTLKHEFPRWIPWVDADFGSGAYLPLVDEGRYRVTLAAAGGLVARPGDTATATKLQEARW